MPTPPSEAVRAESLPVLLEARSSTHASELEREVVVLFDEYRQRLLAYVSAFGITGNDGEELVQEVFLALFRHLLLGKSRRNLRGWLFRVAHNLALKQRRADWQRLQRLEAAEPADAHRDARPNPEELLLSCQRQERLQAVIEALPEQDRLCLSLRAEGLRYREIAKVLGISLGSVSISLTRSLARFLRALGKEEM
jgi:RNA polymerase sigma-70 factor, ECF subfamily